MEASVCAEWDCVTFVIVRFRVNSETATAARNIRNVVMRISPNGDAVETPYRLICREAISGFADPPRTL